MPLCPKEPAPKFSLRRRSRRPAIPISLESADHSYQTDKTYGYDPAGNRTLEGSAAQMITANNRLDADGVHTYTYDHEGNRLTRTKVGEHVDYAWDHRNRLTSVTFHTAPDGP